MEVFMRNKTESSGIRSSLSANMQHWQTEGWGPGLIHLYISIPFYGRHLFHLCYQLTSPPLSRLNSTASNCSGDSAAGISLNTIDRETLEPLQEKKESVGDYESLRPLSRASVGQQGQIYCCSSEACPTLGTREGSRIYEVVPRNGSQGRRGSRTDPPAVPPRFATIR